MIGLYSQILDDHVKDALGLATARFARCDAPEEPHNEDIGRIEAGSHLSGLFGCVQQLTDRSGDRRICLVDHILCGHGVQGFAEAVLETDVIGESQEPHAKCIEGFVLSEDAGTQLHQGLVNGRRT